MLKRKNLSPEQKVAIVRRHLLEHVPVSDLCDEFGIHATQFYAWQKQLFEGVAEIFQRRPNHANRKRQEDAQVSVAVSGRSILSGWLAVAASA